MAARPVPRVQYEWMDDYLVKERLLMYFTKASATTLPPVLLAFLSLTLGEKKEQENYKIAFSVFSLLSLLAITAPLAWRCGLQVDPTRAHPNDPDTVDVWGLSAVAFLSNILLIVTVGILAVLLNPAYVALASPVLLSSLLLLPVGFTVFTSRVLRWRKVLDPKHAADVTFVFNVSSEVTQTSLLGLSAALFGNLKTSCGQRRRQQGEAASPRAAEALLVYTAVFGLAMMLTCSMPPVVTNTAYQEKVANKFFRVAAWLLVALAATAASAAVVTLLQGYSVLALAVVTGVSVEWFRRLYFRALPAPIPPARVHPWQFLRNLLNPVEWWRRLYALPAPVEWLPRLYRALLTQVEWLRSLFRGRGAPPGPAHGHPVLNHFNVVLCPGQFPAMFGALMAVYSQYNICQPIGKLYNTTVFFIFMAIVNNLARMIILREGGRRNEMRHVSLFITIVFVVLALIFIVILVWLQHDEVRNTFLIVEGPCVGTENS